MEEKKQDVKKVKLVYYNEGTQGSSYYTLYLEDGSKLYLSSDRLSLAYRVYYIKKKDGTY